MNRRLRRIIFKNADFIVFIDNLGRQFFLRDHTEYAV